MPNQTDPNQVADTTNVPPVSVPNTDLPPLPDFMNVPTSPTPSEPLTPPTDDSSGSAAPSDLPPVMSAPKKKFGGGKIIATILGLVLLVGGIGAGVVLTQQQQLFNQKAAPRPPSEIETNAAQSGVQNAVQDPAKNAAAQSGVQNAVQDPAKNVAQNAAQNVACSPLSSVCIACRDQGKDCTLGDNRTCSCTGGTFGAIPIPLLEI
jgi:hypothetical protein